MSVLSSYQATSDVAGCWPLTSGGAAAVRGVADRLPLGAPPHLDVVFMQVIWMSRKHRPLVERNLEFRIGQLFHNIKNIPPRLFCVCRVADRLDEDPSELLPPIIEVILLGIPSRSRRIAAPALIIAPFLQRLPRQNRSSCELVVASRLDEMNRIFLNSSKVLPFEPRVPLKDFIIGHAVKSHITVHVPKSDAQISNAGLSTQFAGFTRDAFFRHVAVSCFPYRRNASRGAIVSEYTNSNSCRALPESPILTQGRISHAAPFVFIGDVGEEGEGDLRGMRHVFATPRWRDAIAYNVVVDGAGADTIVGRGPGGCGRRSKSSCAARAGTPGATSARLIRLLCSSRAIEVFSQTPVTASPKTTFNVGVIRGGTSGQFDSGIGQHAGRPALHVDGGN